MPSTNFTDWGIGVALYFNTMKIMGLALLLAGLVSLPNNFYYRGEEYENGIQQNTLKGTFFSLRGTAVCDNRPWALCEDGYCDVDALRDRNVEYEEVTNDGNDFVLVRHNACEGATLTAGMTNFAAILLLLIVTILFGIYQSKIQVFYDEVRICTQHNKYIHVRLVLS